MINLNQSSLKSQKGHILLIILAGILVLAILPVIFSSIFWEVKIVAQVIMIFAIYMTVRSFLGSGPLVLVVSAVLIYLMVFKWFEIFLSLYVLQTLLGLGFISTIIWGLGTQLRR